MAETERSDAGRTALFVAVAFLNEQLRSIEASNARAMFLVGLNVASSSLFVAVLASLNQPWQAAAFPVGIGLVAVAIGLWTLRHRRAPQFPTPAQLLRALDEGIADDQFARLAIRAIEQAGDVVGDELRRVTRWVGVLQTPTATHLLGLVLVGLALVT